MSKTLSYPSDVTDEQWALLRPYLSRRSTKVGHPVTVDRRAVVNAIFYILRTGCQWRLLPHDFPPWGTVSSQFYRWRKSGLWERIHHTLYGRVREAAGKRPRPTAAIIDSQSVKTTEQGGAKGYDAGKKVNGRKRHILVDTLGLLLFVKVTGANIQDRDGAKQVLDEVKERMPRLYLIWADGGYRGKLIQWVATTCLWLLQVVKRNDEVKGFVVLPRRWVVERTFAWLCRNRRLSKVYERACESSESFIYLAMIHLMVKRLKPIRT